MSPTQRPIYKASFRQANKYGDYVDMGHEYRVAIDNQVLMLAKERIPLLKVISVEMIGNGVGIAFFDDNQIPKTVVLTTSNFFGIAFGRSKKLNGLVDELNAAVHLARSAATAHDIAQAQAMAPPDSCHDCGGQGGTVLKFGVIWSLLLLSRWSYTSGVYCRKHATIRGLRSTFISGCAGWWSLWGFFITPGILITNLRSLWLHSSVPKVVVCLLGATALLPVGWILKIATGP